MRSSFTPSRPNAPLVQPSMDENYSLRGLNLRDPDAIMENGETPWTINSRMLATESSDAQVAIQTRKGAGYLSAPVGAAANVSNTATTTGDIAFTNLIGVAQPFTPNASGCLGRVDVDIKKAVSAAGHIILEVYSDNSGAPGTLMAQGSVLANSISTSYAYSLFHLMDAPLLASGTQYWIVLYVQDNHTGPYYVNKTATSGALTVGFTDGVITSSTALGASFHYKTYLSPSGAVKGHFPYYPSTGTNYIVFAQGGGIYGATLTSSTLTTIDTGLTPTSTYVRFDAVEDNLIYVNGNDRAKWWKAGVASTMTAVPSTAPTNVLIWQNRAFFMTDVTRVDFSDLGNYNSFTAVNFFYVPSPKSPDHMTGWLTFQDNMVIFTNKTKHIVIGSDINTFTRREAVGTKGAVSQEAIVADKNFVYFMAPDGIIYRYNGSTDQSISDKVQPLLSKIADKTKVNFELHNNKLRVYFATPPSDVNDSMLVYDIVQGEWFLDTNHQVQSADTLYLDQNTLVEFSSVIGRVYLAETQYSDLGKKIDFKYWTNYKTYGYRKRSGQTVGGAAAKKRIKRFRPIVRTTDDDYTMLVGKDMDFAGNPDMRNYIVASGGAKWGEFSWDDGAEWGSGDVQLDRPSGMSGRGRHIQFRFERKGIETPTLLYGYMAQIVIGRQK